MKVINFSSSFFKYVIDTNLLQSLLFFPSLETTNMNEAYQDFCHCIMAAVKKSIPHGQHNNYIPCWNDEYENLHNAFF